MLQEVQNLLKALPHKIGDDVSCYGIKGKITRISIDNETVLYEVTYNKEDSLQRNIVSDFEIEKTKTIGFRSK